MYVGFKVYVGEALGDDVEEPRSVGDELGDPVGDELGEPVGDELGDPVGDMVGDELG